MAFVDPESDANPEDQKKENTFPQISEIKELSETQFPKTIF